MRKIIAAGNWKMNGSREMTQTLLSELKTGLQAGTNADVLVFPAFGYLQQAVELVKGSVIQVGAQNLSTAEKGAFTGEMSGAMLKDLGCTHVLVGHSERRAMNHETSEVVAEKFAMAQKTGLVPVLCVGETLSEREAGNTKVVVAAQLQAVLDHCGVDSLADSVLAYEPVWAIGTGKTATPEQAQEVHAFLRNTLSALDAKIADSLRILYGGSVKGANASALFAMQDVDGGLVGGASLDSGQFLEICAAA
ncbi:MAG: triose-phosphate isomerase [Gammaproteobacteria bacterium]|nr:triose-phosphate isomerase [Gammaproteobacteria bacterium]